MAGKVHSGKWVREDDWVGERHKQISSPNYNYLINEEIYNIEKYKEKITKLEQKIAQKDRAIEALEKISTPSGQIKLLNDYNNLVDDHNKSLKELQDLDDLIIPILDKHGFSRNFGGMRNLSQTFADVKDDVVRLTTEKDDAIKDLNNKLRLVNILFDPASAYYATIDFDGMYDGLRNFLKECEEEITNKDDRIFELDQVLKGSSLIFEAQIRIIDKLSRALEEEEEKTDINTDYQKHLQEDIKRLAQERKDLTSKIKELKTENDGNKTLRDKELADLRKENALYKTQVNSLSAQQTNLTSTIKILQANIEIRINILNTQLTAAKAELTTTKTELAKEKGWWDKWINDDERILLDFRYSGNRSEIIIKSIYEYYINLE